uniref:intercellular adhesion molecule 1-like isoform X1 n=1 Tax=Semicossyphus pulcher TaxID=241346 RepID=UPI0037E9621D
MFFRIILLVVTWMIFLHDVHVSSCDPNCADKPVFTPSELVVKYGDPASASCSVCQHECHGNLFDIESAVGQKETNGTNISWTVDRLTEWELSLLCYRNNATDYQCCTYLPLTLYKPPDNVFISLINHTGPMHEDHAYTLQCTVQDVAPAEKLIVIFYRGRTVLGEVQSKNKKVKKPVTEIFTFNINPRAEDDGAQYWCQAKLQLGPEGPQPPPVWMSPNTTATVHHKPQLKGSSHPHPITITEGNTLQLNCTAVGNPPPTYTWKYPFANDSLLRNSVLTINSVTSADQGQYTCSVSNKVATITVQFNVVVQGLELPPPTTPSPKTPIKVTTTATSYTKVRNKCTSSKPIHRFILCFMLLFSALV